MCTYLFCSTEISSFGWGGFMSSNLVPCSPNDYIDRSHLCHLLSSSLLSSSHYSHLSLSSLFLHPSSLLSYYSFGTGWTCLLWYLGIEALKGLLKAAFCLLLWGRRRAKTNSTHLFRLFQAGVADLPSLPLLFILTACPLPFLVHICLCLVFVHHPF